MIFNTGFQLPSLQIVQYVGILILDHNVNRQQK